MLLVFLLILVSILVVAVGFLELTQTTFGVGLIGFACYLGILARLLQADRQHKDG